MAKSQLRLSRDKLVEASEEYIAECQEKLKQFTKEREKKEHSEALTEFRKRFNEWKRETKVQINSLTAEKIMAGEPSLVPNLIHYPPHFRAPSHSEEISRLKAEIKTTREFVKVLNLLTDGEIVVQESGGYYSNYDFFRFAMNLAKKSTSA